jgi:hypothetical protein
MHQGDSHCMNSNKSRPTYHHIQESNVRRVTKIQKQSTCKAIIYDTFLYYILYIIYIYYNPINTPILYRQRLKRHVSTNKVIVRLAKNYETLTKWLRAFGIPDGLQYVLWLLYTDVSCHRSFLPGTFLNQQWTPPLRLHASHCFTLQYFPHYVWCSKYSCLL